MAAVESGYLPHYNPCAQCGTLIASPEWVEESGGGSRRATSYLWRCQACGYTFEAVAVFAQARQVPDPLAA
jgi:hypothetical protein